jgi:hypothetical protein
VAPKEENAVSPLLLIEFLPEILIKKMATGLEHKWIYGRESILLMPIEI